MPKVQCPQCQKPQQWSTDNPYRPFCSKRCKLLDLGAWASEEYKVPASVNQDEDEFSSSYSEEAGYY